MKGKGKYGVYLAMVLIGAVGLFAYGCGSQPVSLDIKYDTTAPTGSVQGVVRNYNTQALLANVQIKAQVRGSWRTASTDSNGKFYIDGLPIYNTYQLYYSLSGYVTGIQGAYVDASYDLANDTPVWLDYPTDVGTIYLHPADASLQVIVQRTTACGSGCTGAVPAAQNGATVTVELLNTYDYVQSQTSASSSVIEFTGLPGSLDGSNPNTMSVYGSPIDCTGGTLVGTYWTTPTPTGCPGPDPCLYDGVKAKLYLNYGTCVTP